MSNQVKEFGQVAKGLAGNPLGIIALFIVLVYGSAGLVTAFAGSLTQEDRTPLIYFLVLFPVLVLGVFSWLVSRHSGKLFAPADFKDESNYVKMQLSAVASLSVASSKNPLNSGEPDLERTVLAVQQATPVRSVRSRRWRNQILWVDDRPKNNVYERQAFEAIGLRFTLSLNTADALNHLSRQTFDAVISDMGRKEGPREGYALLDAMRARGDQTPLFFYASSRAPEHVRETREHGGQGCTNDANELFQMVTGAVFS
jgi:CheY-like chemotaxis protein